MMNKCAQCNRERIGTFYVRRQLLISSKTAKTSKQLSHLSSSAAQQQQNALFELRVGNKYKIGRKIGSGSFGDIYLGKCFFI
jgi:hypothetical protein